MSEAAVVSPLKRKKRTNHGWGRKPKSHVKRESTFKDPSSDALKKLEEIFNPFEELASDKLKQFAVHMYYASLASWPCFPVKKEDVYHLIGTMLSLSSWTIQRWIKEFEKTGQTSQSLRGKHSKIKSPMDKEEFRWVDLMCRKFRMFLSLRFYVKSRLAIVKTQNMLLQHI